MADPIDDFPASTATTGQLLLDTKVSGRVDSYNDVDWFRFHADPGQHYDFVLGQEPGSSWVNNYRIYDASGQQLANTSTDPFEPLSSGDYFLSVQGSQIGNYSLTLKLRPDDYSANNGAAGQLAPGAQLNGRFDYQGDIDRFNFHAEAGQIFRFDIHGADAASQIRANMSFTDASGNVQQGDSSYPDSNTSVGWFMAKTAGDYSLNVSSAFYAVGSSYTVTQSLPSYDDYGDTAATAAALDIGASLAGTIEWTQDSDYFRVQLTAGTTYSFALKQTGGADAGLWLSMDLYDSAGHFVPKPLVSNSETAFSFTPSASGAYYLAAKAYPLSQIQYQISASLTPDDYGATAATAGKLTVDGAALSGTLDAGGGDIDWFGVALDAGQTYWVQLKNPPGGYGLPAGGYATINIRDAGGKIVATTTGGDYSDGNTYTLPFVPSAKGVYNVEVLSSAGGTGDYLMQVVHGTRDDVGNDPAHAQSLPLATTVTGALELPRDKDVYKFHVEAGNYYHLQLQGLGSNSTWLQGMSLDGTDAQGNMVFLDYFPQGVSSANRMYHATTTGDIYLAVSQGNSGTGLTGSYTLLASSYGQDDYPSGPGATTQVAIGGQQQGSINYPQDSDAFKVHLEAGRSYVFELQGAWSGGGSLDASTGSLYVYGASLPNVTTSKLPGGDPRLSCVAAATGDYQITVQGDALHLGSYTLKAIQTSGDLSAPVLTSPQELNGVGLSAQFTLQFNEEIMPGSAGITLKDSAGVNVDPYGMGSFKVSAATNQLFISTGAYLAPGATYTLTLPVGSVLDLAGNPTSAPVSIQIHTVPAVQQGTAGNDYLLGTANGVQLDGGDGIDTVYYARSTYNLEITQDHQQTNVRLYGASTGDVLTNVERIICQDGALALDINGNAGQAYRLYQAAFNRAPDYAGLGFWIAAMDKGMSLQTVAHGFAMSPEFQAMYAAAQTDAQYVSQLYHNVLHRDGDASGTSFWLDALQHGHSREDVLVFFSESPENQAALIGRMQHGINYTPYG